MRYRVTGIWPTIKIPSGGLNADAFRSPLYCLDIEASDPKEAAYTFRMLGLVQDNTECYLHTSNAVSVSVSILS